MVQLFIDTICPEPGTSHVATPTDALSCLPQNIHCLPRGRHSEAAHEKRLLCAQKCTRGGVGWVGHEGVGWGGWVMKGWGGVGVCHVGVGWVGHVEEFTFNFL